MMPQEPLLGKALYPNLEMEDDSSDETLSLCDLPLYGNQTSVEEEWEDQDYLSSEPSQAGSSSISSSSQPDDYFEFFSQEFITPSHFKAPLAPPENIIFCGKLIPYKQPNNPKEEEQADNNNDDDHEQAKDKEVGIFGMFGWKSFSWGRLISYGSEQSKDGKRKSTTTLKHDKGKPTSRRRHHTKKHGKKGQGFHVHKMPILSSSSSSSSGRARWHMFLFGISRFSTEVDLRDIRNRQSRHIQPSELPSTTLAAQNNDKNVGGVSRIGSGLWGLIRVLSCGGNEHPSAMVVASINCNSRE